MMNICSIDRTITKALQETWKKKSCIPDRKLLKRYSEPQAT